MRSNCSYRRLAACASALLVALAAAACDALVAPDNSTLSIVPASATLDTSASTRVQVLLVRANGEAFPGAARITIRASVGGFCRVGGAACVLTEAKALVLDTIKGGRLELEYRAPPAAGTATLTAVSGVVRAEEEIRIEAPPPPPPPPPAAPRLARRGGAIASGTGRIARP